MRSVVRKAKTGCMAVLLGVLALPVVADDAATQPVRIAVVNVDALLSKSPQAQAADAKLKADFLSRQEKLATEQKAIQQLDTELASLEEVGTLTEEEQVKRQRELRDRQRTHSREMDDFREEVRIARDQTIGALQADILNAIGEVREREQIDLVLRESDYIVASDRIDITAKVMQYLEQRFRQQASTPASGKQE